MQNERERVVRGMEMGIEMAIEIAICR